MCQIFWQDQNRPINMEIDPFFRRLLSALIFSANQRDNLRDMNQRGMNQRDMNQDFNYNILQLNDKIHIELQGLGLKVQNKQELFPTPDIFIEYLESIIGSDINQLLPDIKTAIKDKSIL